MHETMKVFTEQVTTNQFLVAFFYIFATIGVLLGTVSVVLIDGSMVRAKSLVTTVTQKMLSAFISSMTFMVVGYAIWNLQYYQAFGVPGALSAAIGDWSLWGMALTHYSQNIDTAAVSEADTFQIFSIFFFCFAGLTAALVHGAGLERLKGSASYLTSAFIGAVVVPVAAYLTYGSASFLTNMGLHDFVGAYCLYMVVGVWSVILAWRLGPRLSIPKKPENFSMLTLGILLLMIAIPMFVIGCGFLVPGVGYFGPTMATSGLGIVFTNVFMSFGGGALAGGVLAYRTKKPSYVLFGPVAGYVACSALFDIVMPWEAFLLSLFGPFILKGGEIVMAMLKIDEPKVAPLALGPSIFSVLAAGIVGNGVKQGGFFGIKEGAYAFQHATVSLAPQVLGVVVIVAGTAVSALIVTLLIEKTVGLRVTADLETAGLDTATFGPIDAMDRIEIAPNPAT